MTTLAPLAHPPTVVPVLHCQGPRPDRSDIRLKALGPQSFLWIAEAGGRPVASLGLDYDAEDFDPALRRFGPALRIVLPEADLSAARSVLQCFLSMLRSKLSVPVVTVSCPADDADQQELFTRCGFLPTGCRTRSGDGGIRLQMVNIL